MSYDCIIKGGEVVTLDGLAKVDVAIAGETIAALGPDIEEGAATVIDAAGHYVLPGAIDVHTHLELPFCGTVSADGWHTGSRAAARGGVTTIIDFAIPGAGPDSYTSTIEFLPGGGITANGVPLQ